MFFINFLYFLLLFDHVYDVIIIKICNYGVKFLKNKIVGIFTNQKEEYETE